MQTFRTYMSGRGNRSHLMRLGETARALACKTEDPVKFILDFAEQRFPHYYEPLLEAFYLEADGPVEAPPGSETPAAKSEKGDAARPASEVPHGGFLDWLKDLFGGGGAAKNFDKALKSMTKVDSVVKTIKIPDDVQKNPDSGVQGYDEFSKELSDLLNTMTELSKKSRMLQVADAIKRDPNYVQELQGALAGATEDPDLAPPEAVDDGGAGDPESEAVTKYSPDFEKGIFTSFDGAKQAAAAGEYAAIKAEADPEKKKQATVAWMKKHDHPAFRAAPGSAPVADDKVIAPYMAEFDAGRFNTFDTAHQAAAQGEYAAIKGEADPAKKKQALLAWMQKHQHPLAKKGFKESRRRKGAVVTENVFTEALVLAGIPTRRKK